MALLNKQFRSTALTADTIKNDYKNNGTGHTISHAHHIGNTTGIATPAVIKNPEHLQKNMPGVDYNLPIAVASSQNIHTKEISNHHAQSGKMIGRQQKAAEQRRGSLQLKMYQTNNTSALSGNT